MENQKKIKRVRMPSATSIVARSWPDNIIGVENALPWHLRTDLQLFKHRTNGHAIIMGRRTLESIGRPLPNRLNIILSKNTPSDPQKNTVWVSDPETALFLADIHAIINKNRRIYIIGGEQIYKTFDKYINMVFLTEVFCGNINGDAKFETDFNEKESDGKSRWILKDEVEYKKTDYDDHPFRVSCFQKRKPHHRFRMKETFLSHSQIDPNRIDAYADFEQDIIANENEDVFTGDAQLRLF